MVKDMAFMADMRIVADMAGIPAANMLQSEEPKLSVLSAVILGRQLVCSLSSLGLAWARLGKYKGIPNFTTKDL